jgi:hypothetical protein
MALSDVVKKYWEELLNIKKKLPIPLLKYHDSLAKLTDLHIYVKNCELLLPIRDKAWDVVKNLCNNNHEESNQYEYNGMNMDYSIARHLAFVAYITVTWSIYDNLFNVLGRLTSVSDVSENRIQNPKLHLLFTKTDKAAKNYHFLIRNYASELCAWSCVLSYEIRNWLVHEGSSRGEISLFKSNSIIEELIISDEAKKYIDEEIQKKSEPCCKCSNEEENLWDNGDLAEILAHCHQKIDTLFESILPWSIESLKMQVELFK